MGQEHVVRTLRNALEQGRVHHAYLFVGSRGTGKTSMAKILAASLNCSNGGPTITPCGMCESCRAIASATSLDVVEMDAASNNSVDDIRDLRERVAYAPVAGRYKVYILDEAHMLTPAAWNAFLKTLEEPPPNTIFVLATTEANKVLPTVVDRCHRFDFGAPDASAQIASVLRRVADAESIEIPDEAVALVARSATGSFRDALGTLEQLLAYSGATIALDDVLAVLGAADADLLFGAVDAVAAGDARAALLAAARLAESGRDLGRFFGDLEAHARGLMVVQVLGEVPAELHVTPEQDERLAEQAAPRRRRRGRPPARADRRRAARDEGRRRRPHPARARARQGRHARARAVGQGAARPAWSGWRAGAPRRAARRRRPRRPSARRPPRAARRRAARRPPGPPTRRAAARRSRSPRRSRASRRRGLRPTLPGAGDGPQDAQEAADGAAAAVAQELATEADPTPAVDRGRGRRARRAGARAEPRALARRVRRRLARRLDSLRERTPMLAAALEDASPAALGDDGLTLAWPESSAFLKRKAEDPANRDLIVKAIRVGHRLLAAARLRAAAGRRRPRRRAAPTLSEDDLVKRFMDEFDAEELPPEPEEQT